MDETGIAVQVLSPVPALMTDWAGAALSAEFAMRVNEQVVRMVEQQPTRLAGLGMVPLQGTVEAVTVLEQAHAMGLRGVQVAARTADRELDHASLRPFFAAAAELGMPVFVHPLLLGDKTDWTSRFDGPARAFGLGMTTDTAAAACAIVMGGVAEELPELKVCLAHGGGTFVWATPRLARSWDARQEGPPFAELVANVYVDTTVYDRHNVRYLVDRLGAHRVTWGTDYPLPAQDDQRAATLVGLSADEARMVCHDTASELLGLAAP